LKDRIRSRQRVISRVIAERAFVAQWFRWVHVTFNHEVGIGGDFQIIRLAFHEFNGFFAEIAREQKFVEAVGQWGGCRKCENGVAADENGNGHARAGLVIAAAVPRARLFEAANACPWCGRRKSGCDTCPRCAHRCRGPSSRRRQRDETSAVQRPAFQDGQIKKGRRLIGCCRWASTFSGTARGDARPTATSGAFGHGSLRVGGASNS